MPDRWIEHGTQDELYNECGYDAAGIEEAAVEEIAKAKDKVMSLGGLWRSPLEIGFLKVGFYSLNFLRL